MAPHQQAPPFALPVFSVLCTTAASGSHVNCSARSDMFATNYTFVRAQHRAQTRVELLASHQRLRFVGLYKEKGFITLCCRNKVVPLHAGFAFPVKAGGHRIICGAGSRQGGRIAHHRLHRLRANCQPGLQVQVPSCSHCLPRRFITTSAAAPLVENRAWALLKASKACAPLVAMMHTVCVRLRTFIRTKKMLQNYILR